MTWTFPHINLWWENAALLLFQTVSVVFLCRMMLLVSRHEREMRKHLKEIEELRDQVNKRWPDWKSL